MTECTTCHAARSLGLTLDGPPAPGMHPVGDAHWNEEHEEFANKNLDQCKSCHGNQLQGTVLSRLSVIRDLKCDKGPSFDNERITLAKGTEVSCSLFHKPLSLTKMRGYIRG